MSLYHAQFSALALVSVVAIANGVTVHPRSADAGTHMACACTYDGMASSPPPVNKHTTRPTTQKTDTHPRQALAWARNQVIGASLESLVGAFFGRVDRAPSMVLPIVALHATVALGPRARLPNWYGHSAIALAPSIACVLAAHAARGSLRS